MKLPAYPRYQPSGVKWLGDIAYGWTVSRIKHLVSTPVTDGPHETPEILDEGIPFVSAEAVRGGRIDFAKIRGHISSEDHRRFSKKYRPRRGDIYLVKSGATTGRVAMVETDAEFNIWSPLAAIRCNSKLADSRFLFFYMQSREFQTGVQLSWSYGTQQNIGMGVIQNLSVPLPTLPEQRAIVAFLNRETGRLDRLVAKKRVLLERLKEKRTALISRCVTRGLPPVAARAFGLLENPPVKISGIECLGDIPTHWEAKPLKRAVNFIEGPGIMAADFTDEGVPLLRISCIGGRRATLHGCNYVSEHLARSRWAHFRVKSRDLLISGSASTGFCSEVDGPTVGAIPYTGIIIIRPLVEKADRNFIRWFFLADLFLDQAALAKTGSTIQHFGPTHLSKMFIAIPPLPEQAAIATYLDVETAKLDALAAKVETAIERLQEYRTALITAAVTGKIDLRQEIAA